MEHARNACSIATNVLIPEQNYSFPLKDNKKEVIPSRNFLLRPLPRSPNWAHDAFKSTTPSWFDVLKTSANWLRSLCLRASAFSASSLSPPASVIANCNLLLPVSSSVSLSAALPVSHTNKFVELWAEVFMTPPPHHKKKEENNEKTN